MSETLAARIAAMKAARASAAQQKQTFEALARASKRSFRGQQALVKR